MRLDWNRERHRTRDRLLDYDTYRGALQPYTDTINWDSLANRQIIFGTLETFPMPGSEQQLYYDTETHILYYFTSIAEPISDIQTALVDIAIVDLALANREQQYNIIYRYVPVHVYTN